MKELILATAGHIDHGKTALVAALTGIETDRLAEEKRRGISIEIGFAHLTLGDTRLGIVDLPGHERFIRNMLAGASGADVAMLVIAADDSIMPQTREHLAILKLLRVKHGLIAMTKVDLVEPDWADLVDAEIRTLTEGTFLEHAPIIRTAAPSGVGMDDLRAALADIADVVEPADADDAFRLAVDRAFAMPGRGTVVTGTVWAGRVASGDELIVHPGGDRVRVRDLQCHGAPAESARRGQRAALNLTGIGHRAVGRGDELAAPGFLVPTQRLTVRLEVLPDSPLPIRHRGAVRLHLGTREAIADVRLLEGTQVEPGQSALAQLHCVEPVTAVCGQPLVVRAVSPVWTIGGGVVLQPVARPLSRRRLPDRALFETLEQGDATARVGAAIALAGVEPIADADLLREAGVTAAERDAALPALVASGDLLVLTETARLDRRVHETLQERIAVVLGRLHDAAPLDVTIPCARIARRLPRCPADVLAAVLAGMRERSVLTGDVDAVGLPGRAALTDQQRKLRDGLVAAFDAAGFRPPDPGAVAKAHGVPEKQLRPIVELCVRGGDLVWIGGALYLHRRWEEQLRQRVTATLADGRGRTASQIKESLDTSRKYAVPFCEYLDRIGVTERHDDLRVLRNVETSKRRNVEMGETAGGE